MTASRRFGPKPLFFSAFNRRRAVAPRFRAVRFRPGFEVIENRTLLSTLIQPASSFGTVLVGDFDGRPDLLTVNAAANDLTLISGYDGPDPVTSTISSGGVDPRM